MPTKHPHGIREHVVIVKRRLKPIPRTMSTSSRTSIRGSRERQKRIKTEEKKRGAWRELDSGSSQFWYLTDPGHCRCLENARATLPFPRPFPRRRRRTLGMFPLGSSVVRKWRRCALRGLVPTCRVSTLYRQVKGDMEFTLL